MPYDEIIFDRIYKMEEILNTSDDVDIGFFIEVDLKNQILKKMKQKIFHLLLKIRKKS